MKENISIPDSLKNKSLAAKEKLIEKNIEANENKLSAGIHIQFFLIIVLSIGFGVMVSLLANSLPNIDIDIDADVVSRLGIALRISSLLFIAASIVFHWYATQFERKRKQLALLDGQTNGVVTSMRKESLGAISTGGGWTYSPIFSVEYESDGKLYTTDWEMSWGSSDKKMLDRCEAKHMGEIVPVKYDVNNPANAIVGRVRDFSISKAICFSCAFFGFSILAATVTNIL